MSALRYPLNYVLGTEGRVRILRQLTKVEDHVTYSELSKRAGLSYSGVAGALTKLEQAGVVQLNKGRVWLDERHPLTPMLKALFAIEEATT